MIQGLRTVIYPVSNIDEGKAWYSRVLERAPYFDQPFYVGFSVGGFELGLIPDGVPGQQGARPSGACPTHQQNWSDSPASVPSSMTRSRTSATASRSHPCATRSVTSSA